MTQSLQDTRLYMACLNLAGQRCLVVGGGRVGLEKIEGLRTCGADVVVVAPEADEEVRTLAASSAVEWRRRAYETSDLDGCLLVVVTTSDMDLNKRIFADAQKRSMLINVADVPALCNFILPAIVRRGPLAIAVSTSGASPALAQRLRSEIGDRVGPEHARFAEILAELRPWAKENLATYEDRRDFFDGVVNDTPDPVDLLRRGDEAALGARIAEAKRLATTS